MLQNGQCTFIASRFIDAHLLTCDSYGPHSVSRVLDAYPYKVEYDLSLGFVALFRKIF